MNLRFIIVGCLVLLTVASLCAVFILVASNYQSDRGLCFASYYGDHMVLQKSPERAVVWGYGPEGAEVNVSVSGPLTQNTSVVTVTGGVKLILKGPVWLQVVSNQAGAQLTGSVGAGVLQLGIWLVTLDPVEAGGPYNLTASDQSSTAALTDVLFGDVWLCGGQSNMYFKTSQIFNASQELALAAKYPHVRTFMAALNPSEMELTDLIQVELPWSVPSANVAEFSAVCWLFGRYMYENLQYPVGLVESCWGGTPIEAWSSPRVLQQCGLEQTKDGPKQRNSVLWNAMIHPLLNMTIKGALWYQGEANVDYHQEKYSCSFPAMIDDWRMAFHQGSGRQTATDFPFGFVQLSTNKKGSTDDGFPNIRWHQTADTGFVPNPRMRKTFMAVAVDLPDETSPYGTIHPRDKQDVAYRLTLGARAVAYNEEDVSFLGPFPDQILSTSVYVNITYDQAVSVTPSKDIFEICCSGTQDLCGPKSSWVPAPIMHWYPTTVQLSVNSCQPTDEVAALRYAWRDWPCDFRACPVYGASRILPAPPFIIKRRAAKGNVWKSEQEL